MANHPYYPLDLELSGYTDNTIGLVTLLLGFSAGYFILNHPHMPAMQDFFGQLWKEYAKSDSRYLAADSLVLTLETITVALVSTGHLFSDTLYYVTSILDMEKGVLHSRPEALYFWGYFVVMNAFWIVVPAFVLHQSITGSAQAVAALRNDLGPSRTAGRRKEHFQ
ncbi:ebp domain-containing protein [Neofusicoccum parvum]|uniref:Ebp domain-containing protein n=1 Tax=Neofusicoccum parvum TaxID=310453 RepID=A0ACB5RR13_9PEZI|nr:ebp domain-containing protein [Neofusicoccum parvum]GME46055.1 ebp domain-containing protein [Neofusicoccum parvum]